MFQVRYVTHAGRRVNITVARGTQGEGSVKHCLTGVKDTLQAVVSLFCEVTRGGFQNGTSLTNH